MSKHDLLPVPCLYCRQRFADDAAADRHMLRVHSDHYRHAQEELDARALLAAKKQHKYAIHQKYLADLKERLPVKCPHCSKRFASDDATQRHIAAAHAIKRLTQT